MIGPVAALLVLGVVLLIFFFWNPGPGAPPASSAQELGTQGVDLPEAGDLVGALAPFRQAVASDPTSIEARLDLGNALLNLRQTDEAIEQFEHALLLSPDDAKLRTAVVEARQQNGLDKERRGDREGAIAQFRAALETDPDYVPAQQALDAFAND